MNLFEMIYGVIHSSFSTVGIICDKNIIAVFKDIKNHPFEIPPGDMIAIVDSENTAITEFISEMKIPAITCGLSNKDTITLSSIDEGSAVITLQRTVECFDNTVAEPQEIPVKFNIGSDQFSLMATVAVFILTGKTGEIIN